MKTQAESPALLQSFTPRERMAISAKLEQVPLSQLGEVTDREWLKYAFVGNRFLQKLRKRGWVTITLPTKAKARQLHIERLSARVQWLRTALRKAEQRLRRAQR